MKQNCANIIVWHIIVIGLLQLSNGMLNLNEKEGKICFEVTNPPNWNLSLFLDVNYPQSIAEAGHITFGDMDLTPGLHVLSYKYLTTNMTHDLNVWLDDAQLKFTKSEVPMWYSVSYFHGVTVEYHGDVSILPCLLNESENPEMNEKSGWKSSSETSDSELRKSFFIKDDANKPLLQDVPQIDHGKNNEKKEQSSDHHDNFSDSDITNVYKTRYSTSPSSSTSTTTTTETTTTTTAETTTTTPSTTLKTTTTTTPTNTIKIAPLPDVETLIKNSTPKSDIEENISQTIISSLNYSEIESSRSETSQSCLFSDECEGSYNHDYTIAYSLVGILGVMVLIAIAISVVFHRKKKKLMISSRAKPTNRLRQKIYEQEMERESLLMLKEMEPIYEQIP